MLDKLLFYKRAWNILSIVYVMQENSARSQFVKGPSNFLIHICIQCLGG